MNRSGPSTRIPLRCVHYGQACYGDAEIEATTTVLREGALTLVDGPAVKQFEGRIADLFGKRYGLMVNSGSSANLLAVATLGLEPGSEVITPALNWSTTVAPILQHGLKPVFVDVEPDTFVIDATQVEAMVGAKTSALMIPDLIGNIAQWDLLAEIAERHALTTIHDSADTLGGSYQGRPTGSWSDVTTTSFYASHVVTCAGTGGMFCCNDTVRLHQAKLLRGWGRRSSLTDENETLEHRLAAAVDGQAYDGKFIFDAPGYNFQPTEIGAAFGLRQLQRLEGFIATRIRNFETLRRYFEGFEHWLVLPRQRQQSRTAWLAFALVVRTDAPFDRIELQTFFERRGIQTRPIFSGNILRHPGFAQIDCRVSAAGYPNADAVMEGGIMFGCHQGLDEEDMAYIMQNFQTFADRHSAPIGTTAVARPVV